MNKIKEIKQSILKTELATKLICLLIFLYVKFVKITTLWQTNGQENITKAFHGSGFIFCSWHSRIAMLATINKHNKQVNALVSMHRDGKMIAGLLQRFGLNIIEGSSNKNAKAAAVNLMRCLKNKEPIAIIPDGPRGPAQKMTISPIYYASKTGLPIIAVSYSTKRAIIIKKSWDKLMIPLPFSKGAFVFSKPFYVPKTTDEKILEEYKTKFEELLNDVTNKSDKMVGRL